MELTIWEKALDDAIRSAEKLVRKLKALKTLSGAEEKLAGSTSAAKLSEGVTLRVRSLPGHTGHQRLRCGLCERKRPFRSLQAWP